LIKSDPAKDIRLAWAEIDLSAVTHNIDLIRSLRTSSGTKIMAVVKADSYGHGAVDISRHALKNGVDTLGVAFVEEGMQLREAGIDAPIYILGECSSSAAEQAIENSLILTVNSIDSARSYSIIAKKKGFKASININIDTGMHRLGINWKDVQSVPVIKAFGYLKIEGIFSHFSCASEEDPAFTKKQINRFSSVMKKLESSGISFSNVHIANSAAFFRFKGLYFNMVRTGISIYGLSPYGKGWDIWLPEKARKDIKGLRPVLSLKSRITFIKNVVKGEPISYCGTFRTKRDSVIATIPVGYGDGYSRMLSNRSKVLIKGMEAPVVGNVTMDYFMVDITDISGKNEINVGDEVVLIGKSGLKSITVEDIASILGTINYEVTCMLKPRIPRICI